MSPSFWQRGTEHREGGRQHLLLQTSSFHLAQPQPKMLTTSWGTGAGPAGFQALGNAEQSLGRRSAWVAASHQVLCRALWMACKEQSPQHRTQVCTPRLPCSPDVREQAEKRKERQWRRISPMLAFGLCLRPHFKQFSRQCQGASPAILLTFP